jgi:hypothetical protein
MPKKLHERGPKLLFSQRDYPGYEDYTPGGRAAITAFNAAKGPNYLNSGDSKTKYRAAVKKADAARKTQGKRGAGLGG